MKKISKKFHKQVESEIVGKIATVVVECIKIHLFWVTIWDGPNHKLKISTKVCKKSSVVNVYITMEETVLQSRSFNLDLQYDDAIEYCKNLYDEFICIQKIRSNKFNKLC